MGKYSQLRNVWTNSSNSFSLPEQQYVTISTGDNKTGLITIGTNPEYTDQNCKGFSNFTGTSDDKTTGIKYAISDTSRGVMTCEDKPGIKVAIGEIKCYDMSPTEPNAKQIACCDKGQPIIKQKGDSSGPKGVLSDNSLPQCIKNTEDIQYYMCSADKKCIIAPDGSDPQTHYLSNTCNHECDLSSSYTNFWKGTNSGLGNEIVVTKKTCDLVNARNGCNDIDRNLTNNGDRVLKKDCGLGAQCSNWVGMWSQGSGIRAQFWGAPGWPNAWPGQDQMCGGHGAGDHLNTGYNAVASSGYSEYKSEKDGFNYWKGHYNPVAGKWYLTNRNPHACAPDTSPGI